MRHHSGWRTPVPLLSGICCTYTRFARRGRMHHAGPRRGTLSVFGAIACKKFPTATALVFGWRTVIWPLRVTGWNDRQLTCHHETVPRTSPAPLDRPLPCCKPLRGESAGIRFGGARGRCRRQRPGSAGRYLARGHTVRPRGTPGRIASLARGSGRCTDAGRSSRTLPFTDTGPGPTGLSMDRLRDAAGCAAGVDDDALGFLKHRLQTVLTQTEDAFVLFEA